MTADRTFDVVVVGAGPAGIAAATIAAEAGRSVALIDDNPAPGGQIWRGPQSDKRALNWLARLQKSGAAVLLGTSVVDAPGASILLTSSEAGAAEMRFSRLILATGAREIFLPFPGWTLPGVVGAGALQAFVKNGLPVSGKRIVIAGSGPLLLAVADLLTREGADIAAVAEQVPLRTLLRFAVGLWRWPAKMFQGLKLRYNLASIAYHPGCWVKRASGENRLAEVTLTDGGRTWQESCDLLACAFGLIPNTELALLLGCQVHQGAVVVNEYQQTSRGDIYCAGEPTGIGGVEKSLLEGQIAGHAVTGQRSRLSALLSKSAGLATFQRALEQSFALRPELARMAESDTIVCRCEDVTYGRLVSRRNWREAKLHTRCGMGACQGRVCGPATAHLFGWELESVRPPILPARVSDLCAEQSPSVLSEK